jgi:hypothetical protein
MAEPLITRGHSISHPANALGHVLRKNAEDATTKSDSWMTNKGIGISKSSGDPPFTMKQ